MRLQNEGKQPILTKNQLRLFQGFLVEVGYVKTLTQARKVTSSSLKCWQAFLQVIDYINFNYNSDDIDELVKRFSLEDIFDVYAVGDDVEDSKQASDKGLEEANQTPNKVEPLQIESNCTSNKVENSLLISNQASNKVLLSGESGVGHNGCNEHQEPAELSNKTSDKRLVRGKQKEGLKTRFSLRVDSIQLEELKALGGNTNEHIRRAISSYLDSVRNQTD